MTLEMRRTTRQISMIHTCICFALIRRLSRDAISRRHNKTDQVTNKDFTVYCKNRGVQTPPDNDWSKALISPFSKTAKY